MSFGDRLYRIRKESKFTLEFISEQLSVSYQAYRKYENGKCFPSIPTLIKIAKLFNVSTDYLLELKDEKEDKNE